MGSLKRFNVNKIIKKLDLTHVIYARAYQEDDVEWIVQNNAEKIFFSGVLCNSYSEEKIARKSINSSLFDVCPAKILEYLEKTEKYLVFLDAYNSKLIENDQTVMVKLFAFKNIIHVLFSNDNIGKSIIIINNAKYFNQNNDIAESLLAFQKKYNMRVSVLPHDNEYIVICPDTFEFNDEYISVEMMYERVVPAASYAPWVTDSIFSSIYNIIKANTLVDKYRCYELWQLIKESSKLEGAIIEIGVWRGGTGALIAKQAEICGLKATVYLCDTFTGVVKASENDDKYKGGEHADTSRIVVEELIKKLDLKNTKILVGIFPDETSEFIEENNFRFCHVDVDVYQSAKDVVEWIWPKMIIGGIFVFDDYGFKGCAGITKFVEEERDKNDRLVIHNLNGHGIIIKTK